MWGDFHYATGLAEALRVLGHHAEVIRRGEPESPDVDVVVHLRGNGRLPVRAGAVNVLWVISHPHDVEQSELAESDVVFAAAERWMPWGMSITPLLQCTDPTRFYPPVSPVQHPAANRLLFVGNAREGGRKIVSDCMQLGYEPLVYGAGWQDHLPSQMVGGHYLPNEHLRFAYSAARYVLNDHWEDMAAAGFISNRLFDVTASGGVCVSDAVAASTDLFGEAVQTYTTLNSLRAALEAAPPPAVDVRRIAAQVRDDHTFTRRANELVGAVLGRLAPDGVRPSTG
ncbi:hypothetical protein AWH69_15235 [Janibacter melonis]|uniref:Spore protein YkvP/CgeB glycosyl transferase-like domain-containing protein n=1 Tax=Janibacter melonis TaxID=262209 RepID=A0A176Q9A9_9MICO|nr:hypothetical protein AWH69_15235 [Janibacter melonis]